MLHEYFDFRQFRHDQNFMAGAFALNLGEIQPVIFALSKS
jgi:hypothetical protein